MRKFLSRYALMASVFLIIVSATVYYFYWHWRPFTQNAFVFANTRPVTPLVAGYITDVCVRNNQFVKKGTLLFKTFRPPYSLAVVELEKQIKADGFTVKELDAKILAAKADIAAYTAQLANDKYLYERASLMYGSDAVSQAYAEERLRAMQTAEAKLLNAQHTVTALENSRLSTLAAIERLEASLALARIYDSQTSVYALSDGYITNMSITPGAYYEPGDILFGFIDTEEWYVQANLKESDLSELKKGQSVRVWLWQYPGREFRGVVDETGFSAERRNMDAVTGLPLVEKENEWFLLPQRYPVQVRLIDPDPSLELHMGGSAYVEIDAWARPVRQFFWQLFLWR